MSRSPSDATDCGYFVRRATRAALCGLIVLALPRTAAATMQTSAGVSTMTAGAARVFRGHCESATTEIVEVAGAHLPVTTYTFRVAEHLKGKAVHTVTFRQVGRPDGGPRDLGRLAGLPVYAPGTEYVLFLLPASRIGLTSPAGAADGAFVVRGKRVHRMAGARPGPRRDTDDAEEPTSYESLRKAVRQANGR